MRISKILIYTACFIICCTLLKNIYAISDTDKISKELGLQEVVNELDEYIDGVELGDISKDIVSGKRSGF